MIAASIDLIDSDRLFLLIPGRTEAMKTSVRGFIAFRVVIGIHSAVTKTHLAARLSIA